MTTTITVYLNEARGSMIDGFDFRTARLRKAAEFEVDAAPYDYLATYNSLPRFAPDAPEEEVNAAFREHNRTTLLNWASPILNPVYEQLNVGGDVIPAEEYTTAYRAAGNRSLSVGDVVVIGNEAFTVARFGFTAVRNIEVRFSARRFDRHGSEVAYL